jgi:hypothetical protein
MSSPFVLALQLKLLLALKTRQRSLLVTAAQPSYAFIVPNAITVALENNISVRN